MFLTAEPGFYCSLNRVAGTIGGEKLHCVSFDTLVCFGKFAGRIRLTAKEFYNHQECYASKVRSVTVSEAGTGSADPGSVGIVKTEYLNLALPAEGLALNCGRTLKPIQVAYETYGKLNAQKSNAILIAHALTGDAHAAGWHAQDDRKPGWWDIMIGPGKPFDTSKYFILCSNVLGGCKGTTGPSSINPITQKEYGTTFPLLTIGDMVQVQKCLLDHLEISKLLSIAGGSMGGLQTLEWILRYPEMMDSAMIIASTSKLSAESIAYNEVGRHAIVSDPAWQDGNYYHTEKKPHQGLGLARMIGHITYLSDESMNTKFGRRLRNKEEYRYDLTQEFEVESYLHSQGSRFVQRFDANSYLYLTKCMDYYNAAEDWGNGSLEKACSRVLAKTLVVSFTSDRLYPTYQSKEIVAALRQNNKDTSYLEIKSDYGHDAFLLPSASLSRAITGFLGAVAQGGRRAC
jgi:homoserine O-acetyltransferase